MKKKILVSAVLAIILMLSFNVTAFAIGMEIYYGNANWEDDFGTNSINYNDSNETRLLQVALNSWKLTSPLTVDGDYGTNTYNRVLEYQEDNDLTEDGIAGDEV